MADIDTSPEAVERAARGAWMAHQQTAADTLRALARERDEALADIERIQKERAEFVACVEALTGVLKGERDEALAREAVLHALILEGDDPAKMVDADYLRRLAIAAHSPQEAAAARDAALVERGRNEPSGNGVDIRVVRAAYDWDAHEDGTLYGLTAGDQGYEPTGINIADIIAAVEKTAHERGRREGIEEAARTASLYGKGREGIRASNLIADKIRAPATPPAGGGPR